MKRLLFIPFLICAVLFSSCMESPAFSFTEGKDYPVTYTSPAFSATAVYRTEGGRETLIFSSPAALAGVAAIREGERCAFLLKGWKAARSPAPSFPSSPRRGCAEEQKRKGAFFLRKGTPLFLSGRDNERKKSPFSRGGGNRSGD